MQLINSIGHFFGRSLSFSLTLYLSALHLVSCVESPFVNQTTMMTTTTTTTTTATLRTARTCPPISNPN